MNMRRARQLTTRNKIDLDDAGQIRGLKRRLGISDRDLHRLVAKVGNSISAVAKEVELARASVKPAPAPIVPVDVVQPETLATPV
jgi:Protein of unknown function (DUF3606)